MAFPYDLNTYSIPELDTAGDVMFNHLASRTIILSEMNGWVENNPSEAITGSLYINGVDQGTGISISTGGVVTNNISFPFTLNSGDHIQILADSVAGTATTSVEGLAVTFVGTEAMGPEDKRYDYAFFVEGKIPAGRTIAAIAVPRQMYIDSDEHWANVVINPSANITLTLNKNGSPFGSLIISTTGVSTLLMTNTVENFAEDDVISIFTPGTPGTFVDGGVVQDLTVTFKGFCGIG